MWNKVNAPSTNLFLASLGFLVIILGTVDASFSRSQGSDTIVPPRHRTDVVPQPRQVRYEHFDDYLIGMSEDLENERTVATRQHQPSPVRARRPHNGDAEDFVGRLSHMLSTSDDEDVVEGSGGREISADSPRSNTVSSLTSPKINILAYFRDVPKEHWSCCMLGVLAGDKGFHCQAQFYAARIVLRNRNRSHNRRMPFHGRQRNPTYGKDIMYHFQGCVENRAPEFHKCCYASTLERLEMERWRRYRDFVSRARGN